MKKILMLCFIGVLAACTNTVKTEKNSDELVMVKSQPKNCVYLSKIEVEASVYSHDDAMQFLKNRIAAENKNKKGNVFWIEKDQQEQNEWVMFGPEYKYFMTAHLYNCPFIE